MNFTRQIQAPNMVNTNQEDECMNYPAQPNPTMSSLEMAGLVEKRHDNVKRTIENLSSQGIIQHPHFEEVKNHRGQKVAAYRVGKRDSYVVVAQLSPEFTGRLVDRWQALESSAITASLSDLTQAASIMADSLRLEGSSRITAMRAFSQSNCPQLLSMLPDYAIDAPSVSGGGSSMMTHSASHLLKERSVGIGAAFFNKACHGQGLLERQSRTGRGGKEIEFWCVTNMGLEFGKNVTSPQSPLQTQPHWYDSKFDELLDILGFTQNDTSTPKE